MEVIFEYIDDEYKKFLQKKFEFKIGGECLIKRNIINEDSNFFRYITLYKELEDEEGNYTDFFLFIKNEQKRETAVNFIVQNNIWEYFKKINYNYKNEYKKIIDEKGQEVGYIVRAIELEHIEAYLSRKKQKELEKEIINKIPKIQLENKLDNKEQIQNTNSKEEISINQMQNNINNNKDNNMNNINMQSNFQNMQMQMNMNMMNNMNMNFNNINNNNNMPNWNNFNMNNLNNMNINQSLYERINYLTNENFTLKNTIQLKDNEIKELKQRIDNLVNNTTQLVDFNKIRVVQFISMDHTIICGIKCLLTDTFAEVEEKLYKIYPQYRETNNAFQVDGRTILRFKTIAENNIQEGHGVQILKIE